MLVVVFVVFAVVVGSGVGGVGGLRWTVLSPLLERLCSSFYVTESTGTGAYSGPTTDRMTLCIFRPNPIFI